MKTVSLTLAAITLVLVGVASVEAHTTRYATTIVAEDFPDTNMNGSSDSVEGTLTANQKCLGKRTVKVFLIDGEGFRLLDTDKTNGSGFWHGGTDDTIGMGGKVVVKRKDVGNGDHDHICKSDKDTFD